MAKDGKFGTFAGVYIPSLLTILGVIMYLRLPWILGNGGLYMTLGIIGAAHIVSICTGLSVSSIATDKKVGAGGPYYIISRSLGLPIGGAIGLALFVGMGFAISLHIVGFAESVLSAIGIEATPNAIRISGTLTLIAITAIAFISTSLAIITQYPILVVVAISVVVVFLGTPDATEGPRVTAHAESPSFALMFGIFFPAATGFMSGVNMSGDLRDPKTSIIRGTVLAILSALALYLALTLFLAYNVDPERLRTDTHILEHMALWGPAVIAGIWGATLSSAFGAVLGAPRILQAISADRIAPHGLAKGHGPNNEPRRAMLVAFVIAEAGILIAELNVIARIVSMIYLTQYAFINIACVIESWASPDFRPKFRIPKLVGITGALASVLLMIQLDLLAMMGATLLMIGLFVYLQRRQLTLEAGDAWEGVWATIVRAGLHRLHKNVGQQRNWRPNVLLFDDAGHERHRAIRGFATALASGNGMVTDFALASPDDLDESETVIPASDKIGDKVGVFDARIVTTDALETIASVCQFHGLTGLAPNTLLLPWRKHATDPDRFLRALNAAASRELNILLFEEPRDARKLNRQIDVWWSREAGNLALSVALARFITRASEWERAAISVYIVGEGRDDDDVLRAKALRYLGTTRLDARVLLVQRPPDERLHDLVCNESRTADLVLLGLPLDLAAADRDSLASLNRVAGLSGGVVFLRAGSTFSDALVATPHKPRAPRAPGAPTPPAGVPTLSLPADPGLAATVTAVVSHETTQLTRLHDRIAAGYGLYLDLCASARTLVDQRAETMIAAAREENAAKRRKQLAAATNMFLVEADRSLAQITAEGVAAQAMLLAEVLADLVKPGSAMPPAMPPIVGVERGRALFEQSSEDTLAVRAWKRRKRWRYFYRRTIPQAIPIQPLVQHDHDRILGEDVARIVARFRGATHELAVELGRALATVEWKNHAELSRATLEAGDQLIERIVQSRDEALARLDALAAHTRERIAEDGQSLDGACYEAARNLAATLDRVDAPLVARAAAKQRGYREAIDQLTAFADGWRDQQLLLLARGRLAVRLARFRDRLTVASAGAHEEVIGNVAMSARRAIKEMRDTLQERAAVGGEGPELQVPDEVPYDATPLVARFAQIAAVLSGELPETETILVDDAASALVRGDEGTELVTVPVRASMQSIVEVHLITRLGGEVATVAEADARAWGVLRETMLLTSARPREHDDEDDEALPQGDALTDAIARLDTQLGKLRDVENALVQSMISGLQALAQSTAVETLSSSLLERSGRRVTTQRPSRVLELARRSVGAVRDAAANVIYRRSAGLVYAHETRATRAKHSARSIRELAARAAIRSTVSSTLPLYYRNLFIGQVNINESFFVGRDESVRAGVGVVSGGIPGPRSVLVTGARGAGKTTLCRQIASVSKSETVWVVGPPGGDASAAGLRAALEACIGSRGTPAHLVKRLPDGAVIVIDDLDLWWERRPGGLDAIDAIIELVAESADRIGFVLGGSGPAVRVISELRPLARVVSAELDCQPLAARALEKVIMARHSSTGLGLKLAGRESFGTWTRARLFDAHFDYANGNVGYALRSWVTHIDGLAGEQLNVRIPVPFDWDAIDDLASEHVALLIELVLHKAATADKLVRVTGRSAAAVADGLAELTAIGLVVQNRRRIAQVNPFVHVPVTAWLDRKELA